MVRIAIDIGNSFAKLAVFSSSRDLLKFKRIRSESLEEELAQLLTAYRAQTVQIGFISVGEAVKIHQFSSVQQGKQVTCFPISVTDDLPIQIAYATPATLGIDRVAGIIAARDISPGAPVLVIDIGTAITYDFADADGHYRGGGISPGPELRFRALNQFTARLPLVDAVEYPPLVGGTTEESIQSGVLNGTSEEIDGVINRYKEYAGPDLQVFATGGGFSLFENRLKNINFATPHLVLEGIFLIVQHYSTS
ncbi:MAG: type III pantothenate kinase [Bacteroidota bacterium]